MDKKLLKGWQLALRENHEGDILPIVTRHYCNSDDADTSDFIEGLKEFVATAGLEVDLSGEKKKIVWQVLDELRDARYIDYLHGEYRMTKNWETASTCCTCDIRWSNDFASASLCRTYTNTKEGLRKMSAAAGFEYKPDWNTLQLANELSRFLVDNDCFEALDSETGYGLYQDVNRDIQNFLSKRIFFFNEKEFQVCLANYLRAKPYYDAVETEYFVPELEEDASHGPKVKKCIDLVVRRGKEYLPIELKYCLEAFIWEEFSRFENIGDGYVELKTPPCYDYADDIRRLERLKKRFGNIGYGMVLILSNSAGSYKSKSGDQGDLHWKCSELGTCDEEIDYCLIPVV